METITTTDPVSPSSSLRQSQITGKKIVVC
jgi:hypothetical protein